MVRFISLLLLLVIGTHSYAQHQIKVYVEQIESQQGSIVLALYNQEEGFLNEQFVFKHCTQKVEDSRVVCLLENIPAGKYAIAVFHDKNNNQEMDTNWIGIPKEAYGFSNNPTIHFRAPKFMECGFVLEADRLLTISLNGISRT